MSSTVMRLPANDLVPPHQPSFASLWRSVNVVCLKALTIFDSKPKEFLSSAYLSLFEELSRNLVNVYTITAYKCCDVPTLVRGSSTSPVVGEQEESTQVLVVYYLLREMLKKYLQTSNHRTPEESVITQYLDSFESFTSGVHLIKGCFTYLHWTWQKRGLPTEHVLLKTETVANHLWCEQKLEINLREALKNNARSVIQMVRTSTFTPEMIPEMENVKRLSLNLLILNDGRQVLYSAIIEDPYLADLKTFYEEKMLTFCKLNAADFCETIAHHLRMEELRATFFLAKCSYDKVRSAFIATTMADSKAILGKEVQNWLNGDDGEEAILAHTRSLRQLYGFFGNGSTDTWLEEYLAINVENTITRTFESQTFSSAEETVDAYISVVKNTFQTYVSAIRKIFGENDEKLFKAVFSGCSKARPQNTDTFDLLTSQLPTALSKFTAAEATRPSNDDFSDSAETLDVETPNRVTDLSAKSMHQAKCEDAILSTERSWVTLLYSIVSNKEEYWRLNIHLLQDRLLRDAFSPVNHIQELAIISNLFFPKQFVSPVFKCKQMIRDVCDTSLKLRHSINLNCGFRVHPLLLSKHTWDNLIALDGDRSEGLPADLRQCVDICMEQYTQQFSGKRIEFLPLYSTVVVRFGASGRFMVSVHQLPLLLAFNTKKTWNASELSRHTGVNKEQCAMFLQTLEKEHLVDVDSVEDTYTLVTSVASHHTKALCDFVYHNSQRRGSTRTTLPPGVKSEDAVYEANIVALVKQGSSTFEDLVRSVAAFHKRVKDADFVSAIKAAIDKLITRGMITRNETMYSFCP